MDLLLKYATTFKKLMNFQYSFTLGRKREAKRNCSELSRNGFPPSGWTVQAERY